MNDIFIIAEVGVNHNGDLAMAEKLIHLAADAGANAVKFQTFKADDLVSTSAPKARYQQENDGEGSQYEMLKKLELSDSDHRFLMDVCIKCDVEFMSTAFDYRSLVFLLDLGMRRIKVPSGEITNIPYLRQVASHGLSLILSTGMSTLVEVQEAVDVLTAGHECYRTGGEALSLLHCTSNYPTKASDVNLKAMRTMKEHFGLPVGYSDHTEGNLAATMAVAMGAKVIEKHITLDRTLPGPDHRASLAPEAFVQYVQSIRLAEVMLGRCEKTPTETELEVRQVARRSIVLKNNKKKGELIEPEDITMLRPATGIEPKYQTNVEGKRLISNVAAGSTLSWQHLEG